MSKPYSFKFSQHLRQPDQFKRLYSSGVRLMSSCYMLYYLDNSVDYPRLGVVASKRTVPRAVDRNRVKRSAREIFRLEQERLGSKDIVIIARKKSYTADSQELSACLNELFTRLIKRSAKPLLA